MPIVNREMFEQTSFDSAVPSGAAVVAHRFRSEGQYVVALSREERVAETRSMLVSPAAAADRDSGSPVGETGRLRLPDAMTIDLTDSRPVPGRPVPLRPTSRLTMPAGGYAAFTGAVGRANRALVRRVTSTGSEEEVEFDTEKLGGDDVFAVTLVRPGSYAVRNSVGGHEGRIVVTYPVIGDVPYRPADPLEVRVTDTGLDPKAVTIGPGQGVIFRIDAPSRITVDLVEPDDGPGDDPRRPRPARRWRPPRRPGG